MQPINPATEGLVRIDSYQQPMHPVKPEGEIWVSLSADEILLLAKGVELVEADAHHQLGSLREDLAKHDVPEDSGSAEEQLDYFKARVAHATALLGDLRILANNPTALSKYAKPVN